MKNKINLKIVQVLLAFVLVAVAVLGIPVQTAASAYSASSVEKLEGLATDYTQYLNADVAFRLPDTIGEDQEISIIITVDTADLMAAYEASAKTLSFREFAAQSREAQAIRQELASQKAEVLSKLDDMGIAYQTGEEFETLLTGFELIIKAGDFENTCKSLSGSQRAIIGEEYKAAEAQLVENTVNVYDTGIFDSSNVAYDGSGMVVAVLDTGLDSAHTAFSMDNFTSQKLGMTYEDVAAVVKDTKAYEQSGGLSVDDVFVNNKVPFGYDYADNDPDVYSTHNNHGTHVSGVIVGRDDVITGVAPNAQLVSMKIFSDVMDTARSAWILAALEDCVILGVDVVNMSLGTSCGFSREGDEEALSGVYDKLRSAGISVVAAASNSYSSAYGSEANGNLPLTSNPDVGTVGSPSTYKGVLSVASISGTETPYLMYKNTILYFDESNDASAQENDFCQTILGDKDQVEMEYVIVPGVGRTADYTGLDVKGKIALVRRGDNTFEEKAIIAEAQGAAGILIYNNVSGEIKMNVGEAKLAACSISQDDGQMLVDAGGGKLKISRKQTSGPFISDFSSWGPTPSLEIKPEITGHGGNILSSVTGGSYDRMSGTSMACPNLAGVVVLLRQYVVENFPDIAGDNVKVNNMVNCLLMSTADIALGTNGQPYAVRKQGAGLANLTNSIKTPAYITTFAADGSQMDKTKLELGDDKEKTGVYEMKFALHNLKDKTVSYELGAYVMTEGVSDTKTNAGENTVTQESYILDGASLEITGVEEGSVKGKRITVEGGKTATVSVKLTLSQKDKDYLDASFENGMYVEGFLTLAAKKGTEVDLNVPYLAFYGDWTQAPIYDLEYYETNADELDKGLNEEDKLKADAYATRLIGGMTGDYVSYLGGYYFLMDEKDMVIPAAKEHIALSNQDGTIHSLRYAWTGLLRNAAKVEVTITNDATGEVIFETTDDMVRKSYGDGGTPYPANVEIEFDTVDYNLPNNSTYTVRMVSYLDYEEGGLTTNEKNVYEFPLTIDFEAPVVSDVEFYYEYDKAAEKNKLFAKAAIYDNHYAMSAQLGYVTMQADADGNKQPTLKPFEQYMTPIYSQLGSTTYVTFELTDYIYEIKEGSLNPNSFVLTCYDYALNYATYEIGMPDDYTDFYFDGLEEGITLSPNEVYSLEPLVAPDTQWGELLEFTSSRPAVARIVNNKIVANNSGVAMIKVRDPQTNKSVTFKVTVLKEGDEGYRRYDKPVADNFTLTGFYTAKAYYMLSSDEKLIGDTGDTRFFEGNFNLSMYPSEAVILTYDLDAYFPADTKVQFESSNESIVTVTEGGRVTAVEEGFASVTVKVMMDDRSTYYSETVTVEVKDPYVHNGAILNHYYGNGGVVDIPEKLHLTEIGSFAFANFDYVEKTPEELEFDDAETSKQWYIGESTITKVIIPEGVKKISNYAFANLTALEEIVLPSTLEQIDYGAFYGCGNLQTVSFSGENNLKIINNQAFENCNLQGTVDLSAVCVISDYAFAGNQELEGVTTSDSLLSIGQYAFAGCKELSKVTITAPKVKYGIYAFNDCEALTEFYVNAAVLPEGMFYQCKDLKKVTVGPDVNEIGEFAFRSSGVETLEVLSGNKAYKVQSANHILSADGKTLAAVAPSLRDAFTAESIGGTEVTAIGDGAFSHNTRITSVVLPQVTQIGDYAFGSCEGLSSVTLGALTKIGEYAFFETAITETPALTVHTQLGKYAFSFSKIKAVFIPDGMTIPEGAFSECLSLESVTIGDDVTIGNYAFSVDKDHSFQIKSYEVGEHEGLPTGIVQQTDMNFDNQIEGQDKKEETTVVDGGKRFYYELATALKSLTIGKNAVIGDNAFGGAASLESVTLGENATIGYMSFYNTSSLKNIDLSKVAKLGDYAFSGDVYYLCLDDGMSVAAVSPEGKYQYTYHAPALESVDLSAATEMGEFAFAYCRSLKSVTLNPEITEIPKYAFGGCVALDTMDLSKVVTVGENAFEETAFKSLNLAAAEKIEKYAFLYSNQLEAVTLNENGTYISEGAFAYSPKLQQVKNLNKAQDLEMYAFAYTGLVKADLTGAVNLGDGVFMKENPTNFTVILGEALEKVGDNPFAMCKVNFVKTEKTEFNGVAGKKEIPDYDISATVFVKDGSLYCRTDKGLELITYGGRNGDNFQVAPGTVRITAMAFAGSDVKLVTTPYTVAAIGHKAFYKCEDLEMVISGSYNAPVLEEEFDAGYYNTLAHIPGSGDYGTYTDYDGTEVTIEPMELIPYFMWNATGGMYSNAFYGANFVDYVGYVEDKLTLVRPVNGQQYDSFIWSQYFDLTLNGPAAPDRATMAAIAAIDAIGEKVSYENRALVEAARAAYDKIATLEQQSLVDNYPALISAEQRIIALAPGGETEETQPETEVPADSAEPASSASGWIVAVILVVLAGSSAAGYLYYEKKLHAPKKEKEAGIPEDPTEDVEEIPEEAVEETVEETVEEAPEEIEEETVEETPEEIEEETAEETPEETEE